MPEERIRLLIALGLVAVATVLAFHVRMLSTFAFLWFLLGIAVGLLLRRWWALVLSPIPALMWIGVAFVANPTALWSGEPGGLWGVVILIMWGILPGFYGIVIGLLIAHAVEGRRTD